MKSLKELLKEIILVDQDILIKGLTLDSRKVKSGDLFFAYPGTQTDGQKFINDAIARGASAILCEKENFDIKNIRESKIPIILISNLSKQIGMIASRFYDYPTQEMLVIAVTGTNGKTSCAYLLTQALQLLGKKTYFIGTLGTGAIKNLDSTQNTTPDAITLQHLFDDFKKQAVEAVVMEASSHALEQARMAGIKVDVAVFTNLTRDHLDYHGDMEHYAAAKHLLFEMPTVRYGIFNCDDSVGEEWFKEFSSHLSVCGYGIRTQTTVTLKNLQLDMNGIRAIIRTPWGEGKLQSSLLGEFNVYNLLAVISTLGSLKYSFNQILSVVSKLLSVPGRIQVLKEKNYPMVVVDYAHTPDALEKILSALRPLCLGKLFCVFGCGGDRDKGKRPMMAKIVEKIADKIILTDDNVRFEDPDSIVRDVLAGFSKPDQVLVEHDRKKAIGMALEKASVNDMVLIAGKGHENYQIVKDRCLPFNDILVAEEVIQGKGV